MNHVTQLLSSKDISIFSPEKANSFNFSWVFKDYFNKNGYSFDDVSKTAYFRPS